MNVILSQQINLTDVPDALRRRIEERLTLPNPKYAENERLGYWNGNTPEYLECFKRVAPESLLIPRGCIGLVLYLAKQADVVCRVQDESLVLPPVDFTFTGDLRDSQQSAVVDMLRRNTGTLVAPTGSGKTVIALALIAERRQPALVVVHTKELLNQWVDRIEHFLEIDKKEIGIIGTGKRKLGDRITVATAQTLSKCADEVAPHIGHLIIDECHHAPARTFTDVVSAFRSCFMLGLSATPWRRDGLSKLIFWYVGNAGHEINRRRLVEAGSVLPFDVHTLTTNFTSFCNPSTAYSSMLSELTEDDERNQFISDTVVANTNGHGVSLVLTDRKLHCARLQQLLKERGVDAQVLTGDCSASERQNLVTRLNGGDMRVLVATGQLIGEGFDSSALSRLFIATPIKFDGRLIQYLGRVLRPAPGKTRAVVFDFVDSRVGVLEAAARTRARVYLRLATEGGA